MNGWTLTRVWQIDHKLVVAPSVEEAIELYKCYMGKDLFHDVERIQAIKSDNATHDTEALIKAELPEPGEKPIDIMDIVPAPSSADVHWNSTSNGNLNTPNCTYAPGVDLYYGD